MIMTDTVRTYKAFISYRHLPLEKSIAVKLHRRIEHYIIPRELRNNGVKKLGYVFRDQDELPISGSLSENIRQALDRSEFLIVICTPETEKSEWVLREISYFLEHHDRDHVLAVLADGNEKTAFPSLLIGDITDGSGTKAQFEPLAANIVASSALKRSRLFASESLRILAALIGCPYDALYKREQRYKLRRTALAAALIALVSSLFIATLINRNREIRKNYEQALRNQSVYLAKESMNALEDGDRLRAVALALEALPSADNDRPLVSEAELALRSAVGSYTSPGTADGFQASGVLSHDGPVDDFHLNADGSLLCSLTRDGLLVGWDTEHLRKLWTLSESGESAFKEISGFLNDTDLIVWSEAEVCCIDVATGEKKWISQISEYDSDYSHSRVCIAEKTGEVLALTQALIVRLNGDTGEIIQQFPWPDLPGEEKVSYSDSKSHISPDGSLLVTEYSYERSILDEVGMAVIDLHDASVRTSWHFRETPEEGESLYIPDTAVFTDDDAFVYAVTLSSSDSAFSLKSFNMLRHETTGLHCVSLKTGESRWESEHETSVPGKYRLLFDSALTGKPLIVFAYANHLDILDAESGEQLGRTEYSSRLVGVDIRDTIILCYTENGECGDIVPDDFSTWYTTRYFVDDLALAKSNIYSYFWVLQRQSENILHYERTLSDPTWIPLGTVWSDRQQDSRFFESSFLLENGWIALLSHDSRLLVGSGDPARLLRELELPQFSPDSRTEYHLVSCRDGMLRLWWSDTNPMNRSCGVAYVDPETLEVRLVPWETPGSRLIAAYDEQGGSGWLFLSYQLTEEFGNSRAYFADRLDAGLQPQCRVAFGSFSGSPDDSFFSDPEDRLYLLLSEPETALCADLRKGCLVDIPPRLSDMLSGSWARNEKPETCVWFSADGSLLAVKSGDAELAILSSDGSERCSIRGDSARILSVSFTPDRQDLVTVETDGFLRRYRLSDGRMLNKTELFLSSIPGQYTKIDWNYSDTGFLALRLDTLVNLISLEDWTAYDYVLSCYGYLEDQDVFVCYDYSGSEKTFGVFPRRSLESLTEYGKTILNGWELSDMQKKQYGIGTSP